MGDVPTDEQLLGAADRDPEAFAAFYRRHAAALLAFASRRTADPEAAADVAAETFALALEGCHRFRADRGSAVGWLYGIAKHVLARRAARGAVEARATRRLGLERPVLDDATRDRLVHPDLAWALATLPETQRDAVRARVVDEQDYAVIATVHGTTEALARQRVSRGLAALRRRLAAVAADAPEASPAAREDPGPTSTTLDDRGGPR